MEKINFDFTSFYPTEVSNFNKSFQEFLRQREIIKNNEKRKAKLEKIWKNQ